MEYGFSFLLECPYFVSFRKPTSTNTLTTYVVPPFTTIRGMLSNALGLQRDDYYLQETDLKIGIKIVNRGEITIELAKILKLIVREKAYKCRQCSKTFITSIKPKKCSKCDSSLIEEVSYFQKNFPSSPLYREFLFQPSYQIYLASSDKNLLLQLKNALVNPARPLYLGCSDELIITNEITHVEKVQKVEVNGIQSIVDGIYTGAIIEKLPYKFIKIGKKYQLQYKTVSIPLGNEIWLDHTKSVFKIANNEVAVL